MKILKIVVFAMFLLSFALAVNARTFSGYTYNITEGALNNTNVTIGIWNDETAEPSLNTSFSNLSNASGYWSLNVDDSLLIEGKSVKFIPRHYSGVYVDYIGGVLNPFPQDDITMLNTSAINFYLKEAATINISAVNVSGGAVNFSYMVKDVKLGFPIESEWITPVYHKVIYLPADRNYSIEIFPSQAMPVYYNLNNLSDYSTPKIVNITFNTTTSPVRVTGRFNLSNGTGTFDEMNIINYLLEPGDMVFAGEAMPYNISAWDCGQTGCKNDLYNITSGEYNISLQGTAMSSKVLMFAIAKLGNTYYGAFRNISPTIAGGDINGFNFTLYKLLGTPTNITLNKAVSTEAGGTINVTASKTTFAFVNASNDTLTTATGHLEIELRYSQLNGNFPDFTWMFDVQQSNQGTFTLPLLNYSIKRINMFAQQYAPLKLTYTAAQLDVSQVNITMRAFNPGGIDTDFSGIQMKMFKSSAECDVPSPPSSCDLAGAGGEKAEGDFKPLNAVVSGGKISLRIKKGSIVVHYKNVDMIASGPPDAAFDESASSSTSGGTMQEIWRFGSLGPEIYDSLLIGFPYSGIDDSYDINVSLPYLYDNNWNVVWNTSANGTTGINTNLTDYADYNESWFSGINCSKTDQTANCFVNTTDNIIWMQLPHFSGVGPSTKGTASSSGSSSTGGGGGGGSVGNVYPLVLSQTTATSVGLSAGDKARFTFSGKTHYITAIKVSVDEASLRIESNPIEITLKSGQEANVNLDNDNYNDIYVKLERTSSSGKSAYFSIKEIHQLITPTVPITKKEGKKEGPQVEEKPIEEPIKLEEKEEIPPQAVVPLKKKTYDLIFVVLGAVLVALIALTLIIKKKENR